MQGDPEWAFMVTGYSECIDSFFAFGLFESAKRSGFFPEELVDTFEPVIQEEGRHILFFVNWAAWHRRNMPLWRRPWFELKVLAVWLFLIWERIGIARDMGSGVQDNNFTVTGAKALGDDIDVAELIDICLAENERRMSRYDQRLLRPFAMPALARLVRRFMRSRMRPPGKPPRKLAGSREIPPRQSSPLWGSRSPSTSSAYVGLGAVFSAAVAVGWGGFAVLCLYALALFLVLGPPGTCCCPARHATPPAGFHLGAHGARCGRGSAAVFAARRNGARRARGDPAWRLRRRSPLPR